jgi:HK97 family phage major capsid protein
MNALALLPGAYHPGAVFMCSNATKYGKIRRIKDADGRPFYESGTIDGKNVIVNDQIPAGTILLFNPMYYHLNTQQEITIDISDQSGFRNAQIDYRGYALMDGKPLLSEAFVLLEPAS